MTGHGFPAPGEKVRFGPFEVDPRSHELRKFGVRIKLQGQPFTLLIALLEHPGELVTREDLRRRIWGDTVVDFDHSLGTALNKLREALSDSPDKPLYIETLPRRGYRFIAPVRATESIASPVALERIPAGHHSDTISITVFAKPSQFGRHIPAASPKRPFWLIGAGCAVMVAIVAAWMWNSNHLLLPVRYREITWSGRVYQGENNIEIFSGMGTDGVRIYFSEIRDGTVTLASASVSGGESQALSTPAEIVRPVLADISRDGSTLLVRSRPLSELEGPLWIMPSSGGAASRVPHVVGHAASWLPDGKGIIFASGHDLMIVSSLGLVPQKLATVPGRAFVMKYSPDGSRLRFTLLDSSVHTTSLWEMSAGGKNLHRLLPGWSDPPAECCGNWTANGKYYVFQSTRNDASDIWLIEEIPGLRARPVQLTAGPLNYHLPLPAANDGRLFVIGAHTRSQLLRLDASSGRLMPWLANVNARRIGFSGNGQFMAWTDLSDGLLFRSRPDGSQRLQLNPLSIRSSRMAWSPDSRLLAFDGKEPGRPTKIYVVPASGGVPEALLGEERNESDPSWSPDGKSIVFGRLPELGEDSADKAIYIADFKTRKMSLVPGSAGLFSPRWSPDGRYICAMPLSQSKLMIFDLLSGGWSSADVPGNAASPTWSKDSKYIYFKVQSDTSIYRLRISQKHKYTPERVAGMDVFQPADSVNLAGLSPDDSPLILTQTSTADLYSLVWSGLAVR